MAVRTHVILPDDLVGRIDRLSGRRRRSRFVEEAIREKLAREALSSALAETAGSIDLGDYPHWGKPEDVSGWAESLRDEDNRRLSGPSRA